MALDAKPPVERYGTIIWINGDTAQNCYTGGLGKE
jgi:hypothetical protein